MIREATREDLSGLLTLYAELHENSMPQIDGRLLKIWEEMLSDSKCHIILAEEDGKIVSSCVLVVIPNLTHGQRPYALIENVVTMKDYRNRGFATACLNFARDAASAAGCYKVMLLTGLKLESTLRFYENAGYNRNDKTGFIQWL